jgi:hypothetical protein
MISVLPGPFPEAARSYTAVGLGESLGLKRLRDRA